MKVCIIVTVYKNRYNTLINWLNDDKSTISKDADIILLAQNNDPYKDYDSYCKKENCKVVWCDATQLNAKRHFGYHWAIDNGYDLLIWSDDDIRKNCQYTDLVTKTNGGSNKTCVVPIDRLYSRFIEIAELHPDAGMFTCFRAGFLGSSSYEKEYKNEHLHPSQVVAINLRNTKLDSTIDYPIEDDMVEDQIFFISVYMAGYPIYVIGDMTYQCKNSYNWENNTSLVYTNELGGRYKRDKQIIRQYITYGGDIKLSKKGNLTQFIKHNKYYKAKKEDLPIPYGKKIDEELMKLCKSREVDDALVDEVYEYLRNKKVK